MDLTIKQAAKLLHASESAILKWVRDGTLPSYRIDEKYRLNRVELLEWATARGMKVSPEIFHAAEEPIPEQLLAQSLQRGGLIPDLPAEDKPAVLRSVCDRLPVPEGVNRDDLYAVLMVREALGSTAIGNGIAIPHPRGPIILGVQQPEVTAVYLQTPIPFGALDGKPVSTLFVIVSPSVRLHLNLLSHLMYALQDADFQSLLGKHSPAPALIARIEQIELKLAAKV